VWAGEMARVLPTHRTMYLDDLFTKTRLVCFLFCLRVCVCPLPPVYQTLPTGDRYEGQYEYDRLHGTGTYRWTDGRIYKGMWSQGCIHGNGLPFCLLTRARVHVRARVSSHQ
jgi:hypothetical protein